MICAGLVYCSVKIKLKGLTLVSKLHYMNANVHVRNLIDQSSLNHSGFAIVHHLHLINRVHEFDTIK